MKNLSEALESSRVGEGHFDCSDEYYTEDLKLALISLLDEVVMKSNINRNDDEQFKRGWNDCRQELIKKINEIKK